MLVWKYSFLKFVLAVELIITAGGENVAPVPIEDRVKEELPCVSNCMLIGDKKKFLAILISLKVNTCCPLQPVTGAPRINKRYVMQTEVDDEGSPTDKLAPAAVDWCKEVGSPMTSLTKVCASFRIW